MLAKLLEYSQRNNVTVGDIHEQLWIRILEEKDMSNFKANEITNNFLESLSLPNETTIEKEITLEHFKGHWKYVSFIRRHLTRIFEASRDTNWGTDKVGTFMIKLLNMFHMNNKCKVLEKDLVDELNALFTIPGENISLIEIAYYLTINEYTELTKNSSSPQNALGSAISIKPTFLQCFITASEKEFQSTPDKSSSVTYYDEEHSAISKLYKPPCQNLEEFPLCNDYCSWHERLTNKWTKSNLLNRMKYAIPQRKLLINESVEEFKLAKELFGTEYVKELSNKLVPTSSPIFCFKKNQGYSGDYFKILDIKTCNDFFSSPTDIGFGLTQNLDIKKVIKNYQDYEKLMEPDNQMSKGNITGGTFWSETTLVFLTEGSATQLSQTYPRHEGEDLSTIKLQIHQTKEIANLIMNQDHQKLTGSLELKAGHEYTIDITPKGQITTSNFKAMRKEKRGCLLDNEVCKLSSKSNIF